MTATLTNSAVQQDVRVLQQRFIDDVINAQDLDGALDEIVAEDFVELNPLPGQGPGRAGLADVLGMMFTGFPDLHWTIHDTLVEGDRVLGFSTWTGTHDGEFMGIPATGRAATVETWTIDRFRDGMFVESRIIMDVAGMLGQLGVTPAPASA
ncbi:ester cyclase [Salsipaludibacter albus]|uniref:ester cyclase n=1 Tax=Salsipaludibacter albus TaxID=2849650 RepID=UPI001EE47BEB|nr:ester cyclase [Salsipaludibacter albus]MBY5163114.1 ester cyclase [Salsipaludibacter albus]